MKFVPVLKHEISEVFTTVKQGIFEHIDSVFGWDDNFQFQRLESEYKLAWFRWIYVDNKRVGLICYKPYDDAIHIHLLLIEPDYRQNMYGKLAIEKVHNEALLGHLNRITLSSFTRNLGASKFYERLGYMAVASDEHFVSLSLNLAL